jgi:hypothetical protein
LSLTNIEGEPMKIYKTKLGSPERASRPSAHLGVLATHFYLGGIMQINYIEPGSQKESFFEESAKFGAVVACWMAGALFMYWMFDMCLNTF